MLLALVLLSSCTIISPYNARAYELGTTIKAEALTLMDKATEAYVSHKPEAENLKLELKKAYEYARGRPKNEESTAQWAIIQDPSRNSLGGFLKRWEKASMLTTNFIDEAKKEVSDALDYVIELESGKPHAKTN
jgi:hypothetical protein